MAKVEKPKNKGGRPRGRIITRYQTVELHEKVPNGTHTKSFNLFRNGFPAGFAAIFGVPQALLRKVHLEQLEAVVKDEYPWLRKSAARLFIEGALTGGEGPLQAVPSAYKHRLEVVLGFLDVLETAVYVKGLEHIDELDKLAAPKDKYSFRPLLGGKRKRVYQTPKSGGDTGEAGEAAGQEADIDEDVESDEELAECEEQEDQDGGLDALLDEDEADEVDREEEQELENLAGELDADE